VIRGHRMNMKLLAATLDKDEELRRVVQEVEPALNNAVDQAISDFRDSVAQTVQGFVDETNDVSEFRDAMDLAIKDTEAKADQVSTILSDFSGKMAELLARADDIDADALKSEAEALISSATELQAEVQGFRDGVRNSVKKAVGLSFSALGTPISTT